MVSYRTEVIFGRVAQPKRLYRIAFFLFVLLLGITVSLTASGHATGGARVHVYGHVAACGSGLLRHGLNFSTAWCTMQLVSVEKDWKQILTQKVITLNACCDTACLTFQLPHITTGSFQSHPTHNWLSSEPPTFERT